jgi:type I restriction enzyme, S subunit
MKNPRRLNVSDLIENKLLMVGDGYRAKNDELSNEGLPFARAGNINNGFHFKKADRFPEERLSVVGNKLSQAGDVVFTSKGTVGRFAFVTSDVEQFIYSPQLCFWRSLNHDVIDPRFLYYWMNSFDFYEQFKGVSGQTDMAEYVSLTDQRRMTITLPDIATQRSIGKLLGALDQKIEINTLLNSNLGKMAHSIFKDWFIDFGPTRAKMAGQAPYLAPEIWALFPDRFDGSGLPDAWRASTLDQIADFLNGLALQKFPPSDNHWLPIIKIAQLRVNHCRNADLASANIPEQYVVEDGDILFSWSGSLMQCVWTGGRGALNQHLFKVTSSGYPKWFFYRWIEHHMPHFQSIAASKATTMGHIQRHHLTQAQVTIPGDDVLQAANALIAPLFEKIVSNSIEIKMLEHTRDMLLPKLMSGGFRINNAESIVRKTL